MCASPQSPEQGTIAWIHSPNRLGQAMDVENTLVAAGTLLMFALTAMLIPLLHRRADMRSPAATTPTRSTHQDTFQEGTR